MSSPKSFCSSVWIMQRRLNIVVAVLLLLQGSRACVARKLLASPEPDPVTSYTDQDISGYDIACGPKMTFCKICGGISAVQAACEQNTACMAFTFDPADNQQCGYLKAAVKMDKRTGWTTFVMQRGTPDSPPANPKPATGAATPAAGSSSDDAMVQTLLKAQSGDQKVYDGLVNVDYMFIGCGGTDRRMTPDEVVAALQKFANGNQAFETAGVLDIRNQITQEALSQYNLQGPPTEAECDTFFANL